MAGYLPPGSPVFPPPPPPPPPPRSKWSRQLAQTALYWQSSPTPNKPASPGTIVGVAIGVGAFLFLVIIVCRYRNSRDNAAAHAAAAAAVRAPSRVATLAARPQVPPRVRPGPDYWINEDQLRDRDASDHHHGGGTQRGSPTADLPSFTYNRAVRHNVTGSGDEEATCTVCLGVFQVGERVQLLPVCLHLYHVDCIDPWLEAHSTCPVCRSGTDDDPTMHGGMLPMV